jgi:hypothetical protein
MTLVALARRKIQQFGPYKSLALLFVPLLIVEPLKFAGLAFAGLGHWVGGACMIIGAYAAGFLFVDRLFRVVKSKLLTMKWFAALAATWNGVRSRAGDWIDFRRTGRCRQAEGPGATEFDQPNSVQHPEEGGDGCLIRRDRIEIAH